MPTTAQHAIRSIVRSGVVLGLAFVLAACDVTGYLGLNDPLDDVVTNPGGGGGGSGGGGSTGGGGDSGGAQQPPSGHLHAYGASTPQPDPKGEASFWISNYEWRVLHLGSRVEKDKVVVEAAMGHRGLVGAARFDVPLAEWPTDANTGAPLHLTWVASGDTVASTVSAPAVPGVAPPAAPGMPYTLPDPLAKDVRGILLAGSTFQATPISVSLLVEPDPNHAGRNRLIGTLFVDARRTGSTTGAGGGRTVSFDVSIALSGP